MTMEEHKDIASALAAAQADLKNPPLTGVNGHFNSKYATLADVRNTVQPALAKHGISVIQEPVQAEGGVGVYTTLLHASGQSMRFGPTYVPAAGKSAHAYGSALTYARRYALQAVCGVVGEEDDDGNAAVSEKPAPKGKPEKKASRKPAKSKGDVDLDASLRLRLSTANLKEELDAIKKDIIDARAALGEFYEPLVNDFKGVMKSRTAEEA